MLFIYFVLSGDVSFSSLATREDDAPFTSFVNCVVLGTIYADGNGITKEFSKDMPLMSIFGRDFNWALRDAIAYSGSYDQIYRKHFWGVAEEDRGRNTLNTLDSPQLHSFPGLQYPQSNSLLKQTESKELV